MLEPSESDCDWESEEEEPEDNEVSTIDNNRSDDSLRSFVLYSNPSHRHTLRVIMVLLAKIAPVKLNINKEFQK